MSLGVVERRQAVPHLARGLLLLGLGLACLCVLGHQDRQDSLMAEALGMALCVVFGTRELNRGLRLELGRPD